MYLLCEEKTVKELYANFEDGFIFFLFDTGIGMSDEGLTITAMEELITRKKNILVETTLLDSLRKKKVNDALKYAISETLIEIAEKESNLYKLGNQMMSELAESTRH